MLNAQNVAGPSGKFRATEAMFSYFSKVQKNVTGPFGKYQWPVPIMELSYKICNSSVHQFVSSSVGGNPLFITSPSYRVNL